MKRLLLAPLILGLLSPFSAIAEEKTFKCLELGREACIDKIVAISACGYLLLDLGDDKQALEKNYKFFNALISGLKIKDSRNYLFPVTKESQARQVSFTKQHCPDQIEKHAFKAYSDQLIGENFRNLRTIRKARPLFAVALFKNYIQIVEKEN
tara:strand:+ start:308 stop:766 length:459 start_codon:yes stop_codon:yes gene_type:complete